MVVALLPMVVALLPMVVCRGTRFDLRHLAPAHLAALCGPSDRDTHHRGVALRARELRRTCPTTIYSRQCQTLFLEPRAREHDLGFPFGSHRDTAGIDHGQSQTLPRGIEACCPGTDWERSWRQCGRGQGGGGRGVLGAVIVPGILLVGIFVSMPGGLLVAVSVVVCRVVAVAVVVILIAAEQQEEQGEDKTIHGRSSRAWGGRP